MSPLSCNRESVSVRFPRVSGDEPERTVALAATLGFSPRERG